MIDLTFDTTTGIAELVEPVVFKAAGVVNVRITFSTSLTGLASDAITLSISTDEIEPVILAYLEVFTGSGTTRTGVLDVSDVRLVDFMSHRGPQPVSADLLIEVRLTRSGNTLVAPSLPCVCEPPALTTAGGFYVSNINGAYGSITLVAGGNMEITEGPDGTFTFTSTAEGGGSVSQSDSEDLEVGITTLEVTFDSAFEAIPSMETPAVIKPNDDADNIHVVGITVNAAGFKVWFNGEILESGYTMDWEAIERMFSETVTAYQSPGGQFYINPSGQLYIQP